MVILNITRDVRCVTRRRKICDTDIYFNIRIKFPQRKETQPNILVVFPFKWMYRCIYCKIIAAYSILYDI